MADFAYELCHCRIGGGRMPARALPHYCTPEQVRQILAAIPAGRPWLFALLLWQDTAVPR